MPKKTSKSKIASFPEPAATPPPPPAPNAADIFYDKVWAALGQDNILTYYAAAGVLARIQIKLMAQLEMRIVEREKAGK